MEDQALARLEALRKHNAARDWVNSDLYRLLYKPDLYEVAYEKVKSKPGNLTAGVDGTTLDGFSIDALSAIIGSLRDESFQFRPARRVFIPKGNGKARPLGVVSPRDKIVQEALHLILEAIYDSPYGAYFLDCSHGFRPGRSCHTALQEFRHKWTGIVWIIEGDIKSCFDEIDHQVLVSLLRRKIVDERFLSLVWKGLRAGYLWQKESHDSLLGSAQGSILSPILANIYLHELDVFVEGRRQKYEKGRHRKTNPEYRRIAEQRLSLLRKGQGAGTPEVKGLTQQMRSLPSMKPDDPDYVRIKYLRYADDWIVGIIGPKELAVSLRDEIQAFLKDTLKLQLSLEKTRITHAKTEEAFFLGTWLKVGQSQDAQAKIGVCRTATGRRIRKRVTGSQPIMKAPIKRLIDRLHRKGFCAKDGFPAPRKDWTPLDVDQIVNLYNSILRGLLNYYRFTNNFPRLVSIQYILRFSLAKTLAQKFRTSIRKLFRKHGRNLRFQWDLPEGRIREVAFAENTDWSVQRDAFVTNPPNPDLLGWHRNLRTRSKLGFPCLICGSDDKVEMHHVHHIRKMTGRKPDGFTAVMGKLNRKQVPVCEACHRKIHLGEYDGLRLQDLAYDFTA